MNYRYYPIERNLKKFYRKIFPIVPVHPYKEGPAEDICKIDFFPPKMIRPFFDRCVRMLQGIKGRDIGNYLEFGVFNGSSMSSMYLTAKKMHLDSMRFFGFDAFQGLPREAEFEDDGVWKKGFYSCPFEKLKECLERRSVNPEDINWVKGWYKDTLNEKTKKRLKIKKPGIVLIDCDTYSSSKRALSFIGPMINEAVIICFDDWKLNDLDLKGMGEYKSFNEFLEANPHLNPREIKSYNRKSRSFLLKPTK